MVIKKRDLYINIIFFWYCLALLSYFIYIGWWIRDGICVFILIFFSVFERKSTIKSSKKFLYLILITVIGIIIGLLNYNNYFNSLITIRCVFLYPLLIWIGNKLYKRKCDLDKIINLTNYFILFIFLIGVMEEISPEIFEKYIYYINQDYSGLHLGRSGIGFGIGSIFGARQIFAMWLCVGIMLLLNNRFIITKQKKLQKILKNLLVLLYFLFLFFTLSRTAILTGFALIIFYLLTLHKKAKSYIKILLFSVMGLTFIGLSNLELIEKSISMLYKSLKHMDFGMSGRFDYWKSVIGIKITLLPNLAPVGVSKYFDESMGTADSSYVRFLMAYGLLIFIIIIFILIFYLIDISNFKGDKKFLLSLIVLLGVSSIAMDMTAFFPMMIPIYLLIGYEYEKLKVFKIKIK